VIDFNQPELSIDTALNLLQSGEVCELHGMLPWGSNATLLATVSDGAVRALAVYKPQRGERPLWDFPEGSLCKREVAAFEVSELIGWHIVPATVLRVGPHGVGSLQYFMPHDPEEHYFTFDRTLRSQLKRIALFDLIINNADRKGGHCLLADGGRLWAIDHGVCFHTQPKLRTVIWDFADQPIPRSLRNDLSVLCERLDQPDVQERLLQLLSAGELDALRRRVEAFSHNEVFPDAGPGRSYPWPPV